MLIYKSFFIQQGYNGFVFILITNLIKLLQQIGPPYLDQRTVIFSNIECKVLPLVIDLFTSIVIYPMSGVLLEIIYIYCIPHYGCVMPAYRKPSNLKTTLSACKPRPFRLLLVVLKMSLKCNLSQLSCGTNLSDF